MKNIFKSILLIMMCGALLLPNITVFAQNDDIPEWEDVMLTEDEFNEILSQNPNNAIQMYATGLITNYAMGIAYNDGKLYVTGKTWCSTSVVKCGFKEVIIQRKASISDTWSDYITYRDLYIEAHTYALSKALTVPSGYYYRVTCKHYAKKNILSTQTINNTSNIVHI